MISVLLTLAAWHATRVSTTARAGDRFRLRTGVIESSIRQRLSSHEGLLRGVVGLFDASPSVTRDAWIDYVDAVRPERSTPGLQRVGFSVRVPASGRRQLEQHVRAESLPFAVWPDGVRDEYHAILFVHPFKPGLPAFGYDMFTEPVRREAMTRARDLGVPAMSGHVGLLQDDEPARSQPGVLLYLPVYRRGLPVTTTAERRVALSGFAFGVFRVHDLLDGIFDGQYRDVDFEIYDGVRPREPDLLYRTTPGRRLADEAARANDMVHAAPIDIAGRPWLLLAMPADGFRSAADRYQQWLIAGSGLAINLLFWAALRATTVMRGRALVLAEGMAEAVRVSEAQSQLMVDSITDHAIFRLDAAWNVVSWNDGAERMLGYTEAEALHGPAARFWIGAEGNPYMANGQAIDRRTREGWHARKDGHRFWGVAAVAPLRDGSGGASGYVVILRDDTKHRQAMEALAETSAALEQRTVALGRFNRLASGRELRMIELKRMVNDRSRQLGMPAPFDLSFADEFADVPLPQGDPS